MPQEFTRSREDGLELEPLKVVVRFPATEVVAPDAPFETVAVYGGCDALHPGKCHVGCERWKALLSWSEIGRELRGSALWVVYTFELGDCLPL